MYWKNSRFSRLLLTLRLARRCHQPALWLGLLSCLLSGIAHATPPSTLTPTPTVHPTQAPTSHRLSISPSPSPTPTPEAVLTAPAATPLGNKPIKMLDVDKRTFTLNRKGRICIIFGTDADSGDLARKAGETMYPFQGRHDFQMTVVVDLSGSMATWAPNLAEAQVRKNLDDEALALKPYYAKNNNLENPRKGLHVVADFDDKCCFRLGWPHTEGHLRGILFGANGKEIIRWSNLAEADLVTIVALIKKQQDELLDARSQELPPSNPSHGSDE